MNMKIASNPTVKIIRALVFSALSGFGAISISYAEIVDLDWVDRSFTRDASIAPQKFLEVCGPLKKGETIAWEFKGSAATDFNIHYHVGKKVSYPQKRKGVASATGQLVVPIDQDYCWMWSNKGGEPVSMSVTLKK